MNKESLEKLIKSLLQSRYLFYAVSLVLSLGIGYYAYFYHIKGLLAQIETLKKNIVTLDRESVEIEIEMLQSDLDEKEQEYAKIIEENKSYETAFYKDTYDVIVDILGKVNKSFFNILEYRINDNKDEMYIKMTGAYLNLINFLDFIQTIKANVDVEGYKIYLQNNKMMVELNLKVGVIKI